MSKKRMFQILDELNVMDTEQGTAYCGVCADFVSAQKTKLGGHITMGVPADVFDSVALKQEKIAVLVIIDKKEYDKIDQS